MQYFTLDSFVLVSAIDPFILRCDCLVCAYTKDSFWNLLIRAVRAPCTLLACCVVFPYTGYLLLVSHSLVVTTVRRVCVSGLSSWNPRTDLNYTTVSISIAPGGTGVLQKRMVTVFACWK